MSSLSNRMVGRIVGPMALGVGFVLAVGSAPGCDCGSSNPVSQFHRDLAGLSGDLSGMVQGDGMMMVMDNDALNACGDEDPSCTVVTAGPTGMPSMPFPLPTDDPPPANVQADGVGRDPTGAIILDSSHANFDFLWVADDMNYNIGFVSKISTKPRSSPPPGAVNPKYVEVARYASVTCYSDPTAGNGPDRTMTKLGMNGLPACDGTKGCCDNSPVGHRNSVNLISNRPSRTAVDFNGDVWVANRAFGLQSSVTKIANKNDPNPKNSDCVDRNGNGKIDTSFDANNDGIIDTDCNQNNIPDDLIDTDPTKGGTACLAGHPQEFFGLDDECVLFTTNTDMPDKWGRPLALGASTSGDFGPSDAWAGHYVDALFNRVNGKTGFITTTATIQPMLDPLDPTKVCNAPTDCVGYNGGAGGDANMTCDSNKCMVHSHPYGATIDQTGILWAPNIDGHFLFYFDTTDPTNPSKQGVVGAPTSLGYTGAGFYGISLDGYTSPDKKLVQQIWLAEYGGGGGNAFRYRPVRDGTFASLKNGTWAFVTFNGAGYTGGSGRGIAADNRQPQSYAWVGHDSAPGGVGRIPIDIADGPATLASSFLAGAFAGNTTLGVGVANDLDIWGVNQGYGSNGEGGSLTHYSVAANGDLSPADRIELSDNPRLVTPGSPPTCALCPHPYTYSDFTGFGLRNFTNPRGVYQWTQTGCGDGEAGKTKWLKVIWDADVPTKTAIEVRVRSADDLATLQNATFSAPYTMSPADLQLPPPLMPNPSGYMDVQFTLTTTDKDLTPKLKSMQILYECVNGVG